jgi:hypothetical protein
MALDTSYLWADGFDDLDWSTESKYGYGLDAFIVSDYNGAARTGPAHLQVFATGATGAASFVGKDLPRAVAALTFHLAVRPWQMSAPAGSRVQLLSWRDEPAGGIDRLGNNAEMGALWLEKVDATTAQLVVATGASDPAAATSPADLQITDGLAVDQWQQLCITIVPHPTAGSITALLEGVDPDTPWWSATGINTDNVDVDNLIRSVTVGHAHDAVAGASGYDVDDLLIAEEALGRVRCEFLPPNADGTDADWTVNTTGIDTSPTGPTAFQALYQNQGFEPDEDISELAVSGLVLDKRHSVLASPLPDPECGGLVIGVIPVLTLRATDATLSPTATAYLKIGGASGTRYEAATDMALRENDPASEPFAGASGYTTHQETCWAVNPATSAAWDHTEIPDVEVGVKAFNAPLSWTTAGLLCVLQHPLSGGGTTPGELRVRRDGAFKTPTTLFVRRDGVFKPVRSCFVRRDGAWKPVSLGGSGDYCPIPPATVAWADDFTDLRLNRRTWEEGMHGGASVAMLGANGVELAGPNAAGGAIRWAGVTARVAHNPVGLTTTVEVPQVVESASGRWCSLEWEGPGSFEDYGIRYAQGNVEFYKWVGTSVTTIADAPYNFALHRWWRLRHDPVAAEVVAETSQTGAAGSWALLGSEGANPSSYMTDFPVYAWLYSMNRGSVAATQACRFRHFSADPVAHL